MMDIGGPDRGPDGRLVVDVGVDEPRQRWTLLVGRRRLALGAADVLIGADATCHVRLEHRGVAPQHATVALGDDGGHDVVDHSNGQGTFLNGQRLVDERRRLARGDTLAIGGQLLHYVPASSASRTLGRIAPVDAGRVRTSDQETVIGRARGCAVFLDHPTVSRRHARISRTSEGAVLEDLGSAVGTQVNGRPVKTIGLRPGDQIAVGPFRIVFDGEELVERPLGAGLPLRAEAIRVDADRRPILQPTSVSLQPGELVAIIGESGAGKSTLLKALAGVRAPDAGEVLVGGEPVTGRLNDIGYVPQFEIVHGALTVREALDFAARLRLPKDTTAPERRQRVDEVIVQLGLVERADLRVDRLSGGQRKRVGVGTELLHRPGVLFLDEPTTGLDPATEKRTMDLFRSIADDGYTVALVTHAPTSLEQCDRVIVMGRGGFRCFDGSLQEACAYFAVDRPTEIFVAVEQAEPAALAAHFEATWPAVGAAVTAHRPSALPPRRPARRATLSQTRVLAARYARLFMRDRRLVLFALAQVPILAVLTALLFDAGVFNRAVAGQETELFAGDSAQLLFLLVTVAIWLGAINAAREIVKERSVVARELAIGVRVQAYLLSKVAILGSLAVVQTGLLAGLVLTLRPLQESSGVTMGLVFVLIVASLVAVAIGLLVSALASSEDQATGVIPVLLVPQLLFGGAIVSLQDMQGPVRALADAVHARWAFDRAGEVVGMQTRIASDATFAPASHYGSDFFGLTGVEYLAISAVFIGVCWTALTLLVRRRSG